MLRGLMVKQQLDSSAAAAAAADVCNVLHPAAFLQGHLREEPALQHQLRRGEANCMLLHCPSDNFAAHLAVDSS
jgi:hypothetical protein